MGERALPSRLTGCYNEPINHARVIRRLTGNSISKNWEPRSIRVTHFQNAVTNLWLISHKRNKIGSLFSLVVFTSSGKTYEHCYFPVRTGWTGWLKQLRICSPRWGDLARRYTGKTGLWLQKLSQMYSRPFARQLNICKPASLVQTSPETRSLN